MKPSITSTQAFVKFFGIPSETYGRSMHVMQVLEWSGCHWACTYPKRVRNVRDGDVIFFAQVVNETPTSAKDRIIFGRAIALAHQDKRDIATDAEILARPWKRRWPYYVRVQNCEFVNSSLEQGIRLSDMMEDLKGNSFAPAIQRPVRESSEVLDPKRSLNQQSSIRLSQAGFNWMMEELEARFAQYGKISKAELSTLDYPTEWRWLA